MKTVFIAGWEMSRKDRITELKRKNRNYLICKAWNEKGINISLESFLDLNETLYIQKEIINKLDEMDEHKESVVNVKDRERTIIKYKEELKRCINKKGEYIFFINESTIYGAVILTGKTILDNIDYIISESELMNNSCCILCCSNDIKNGICVWAGEYDDRIYAW